MPGPERNDPHLHNYNLYYNYLEKQRTTGQKCYIVEMPIGRDLNVNHNRYSNMPLIKPLYAGCQAHAQSTNQGVCLRQ